MYKVLHNFYDIVQKVDYAEGDVYPKAGFETDPARVTYLQSKDNPYKKAFISQKIEEKSKKKTTKKKKVE